MNFEDFFTSNVVKLGEKNDIDSIADVFAKSFSIYFKDLIDVNCLCVQVGINSVEISGVLLNNRNAYVEFKLNLYREVDFENGMKLETEDYTMMVHFNVHTVSLYYGIWERNREDRYGINTGYTKFPKDIRWFRDNLLNIYEELIKVNRLSTSYVRFHEADIDMKI